MLETPRQPGREAGGKPPRGRPRSRRARQAILAATSSLLEERGYEGLAIEAVAARAGVGKQTIYRWWQSKADLVMEAFADLAEKQVPLPDTGSVDADLRELLRRAFAVLSATPSGEVVAGLLVAARKDPTVARSFRERFVEGRREAVRKLLYRGVERGELRPDLDLDLVVDAVYGPMWYRLLVGHAPLDEGFADDLVSELMMGMASHD